MTTAEAVIIGAGPAGLAAALELTRHGVEPWIIDENQSLGGQIGKQPTAAVDASPLSLPLASQHVVRQLLAELEAQGQKIKHVGGATVIGVFEELELLVTTPGGPLSVRAETVLAAGGAHDRIVPFPGWTLPGVISLGGLQTLVKHHGILPGERMVLAGSGLLLLGVAAQLCRAGYPPAAVIDTAGILDFLPALPGMVRRPRLLQEGAYLLRSIRERGVPVLRRRAVVRARGTEQVDCVEVARVDSRWRPDLGRAETLDTDCLAVGYHLVPESALVRMAGASFSHRPELGGWVPDRDEALETTCRGLFAAGDGSGVQGAEIARLEGRLAGLAMAERLGKAGGASHRREQERAGVELTRAVTARRGLDRLFQLRPGILDIVTDDTLICRCEEVTWGEVRQWLARGLTHPADLKRATRAGMGRCQGRFCQLNLRDLLQRELGARFGPDFPLTARPPAKPVTLEQLASFSDDRMP